MESSGSRQLVKVQLQDPLLLRLLQRQRWSANRLALCPGRGTPSKHDANAKNKAGKDKVMCPVLETGCRLQNCLAQLVSFHYVHLLRKAVCEPISFCDQLHSNLVAMLWHPYLYGIRTPQTLFRVWWSPIWCTKFKWNTRYSFQKRKKAVHAEAIPTAVAVVDSNALACVWLNTACRWIEGDTYPCLSARWKTAPLNPCIAEVCDFSIVMPPFASTDQEGLGRHHVCARVQFL